MQCEFCALRSKGGDVIAIEKTQQDDNKKRGLKMFSMENNETTV